MEIDKGNKLFNVIMHEKDMINVFILVNIAKYAKNFLVNQLLNAECE